MGKAKSSSPGCVIATYSLVATFIGLATIGLGKVYIGSHTEPKSVELRDVNGDSINDIVVKDMRGVKTPFIAIQDGDKTTYLSIDKLREMHGAAFDARYGGVLEKLNPANK